MTTDFAGLNGFVWWIGVVEDRQDPLKLGRVRVRIIGWHDFDENAVPTDALPWAQIQQAPTGPRTFGSVKEGEWVTGHFLDGNNAQEPVIFGVYPGIISEQSRKAIAKNAQAPQLPAGLKADIVGEPSLPPMARGRIANTAIDVANNTQEHVCDITSELKRDVALVRLAFSKLMDQIRTAIRALILKLGFEPSGEISKLVSLAKALVRELKYIQDILDEIVDIKNVLIDYARRVRAMVDYILSLPAKLLKLLAECLSNFLGAIGSALSSLLAVPGLEGVGAGADFGELFTVLEEAQSTTKKIISDSIDIATVPAQLLVAVATPSTQKEMNAAANTVASFISSTSANTSTVTNTNTYSSTTISRP